MHPILLNIPLTWPTLLAFAAIFGIGGTVRARFKPADRDVSYLASFLGMAVKWGEVQAPWGKAIGTGAMQAVMAAAAGIVVRLVAKQIAPGFEAIPLHVYGVMMATAFIVGIWLATRQAKHELLPSVVMLAPNGKAMVDAKGNKLTISASDLVSDLAFYLLLAGLAGSRILYIITRWEDEYSHHPMKIFQVWEGGLVWYGGLIAATLVAFWFVRKHKVSFWPYADILVPGVALGHAIGRIGCFSAGCCFGNVAAPGFPLTMQFPAGSPALAEHINNHLLDATAQWSLPVYPTQLLEASGETLIFLALLFIRSKKRFHGQTLLTYFILYPILRFVIEMFRGDSIRAFLLHWPEKGHEMLLSTSQAASIVVAIAGIVLTIGIIRGRGRIQTPATSAKPA
jgi:phosphatidylglycerol:prolipoprotein diacylglycerol transferase